MSDRTYAWAAVYACPARNLHAAAAVTLDAGIVEDGPTAPYGTSKDLPFITLGQRYSDAEVVVGTARDLANALLHLECTFETGEDPKYEFPGELWRGDPSLGLHFAGYDGHHVYIAEPHLDQAIHTTRSRDDLISRLHDLLGTRWQETIGRVKPPEAS